MCKSETECFEVCCMGGGRGGSQNILFVFCC